MWVTRCCAASNLGRVPRSRAIAAATLAVLALPTAPAALGAAARDPLPPPPPPPLAFRTATLHREARAIDVELIAVARSGVRVTVSRHGTRLGRGTGDVERGSTFVRVPIGPKGIKPLRRGIHVDIAIDYGGPIPLHAHPALLLAPPGGGVAARA
jgi:hypothetical protein